MTDEATVVLVHGAWSGAWIWHKVIDGLRERGIDVVAVDLPSCSATDTSVGPREDARHVRDVAASIGSPVLLVGSSYGGVVITGAGVEPNVKRLVYIGAGIPDAGEPVFQHMGDASSEEFTKGINVLDDGRLTFDAEVGVRRAFQHASAEDHDLWRANKSPAMSFGSDLNVALDEIAWKTVPTTYVVCADDGSLDPDVERRWAKERATEVIEWPTDHCPQVSRPDLVVDLLEKLATA